MRSRLKTFVPLSLCPFAPLFMGCTGPIWPTDTTAIFKAAVAAESNVKYTLMTVDFVKPDHPLFGKIVAIPAQPGKNFTMDMYDPATGQLILHVETKRDAVLDRLYAGTMGVQGQQFLEAQSQREFAQQQINTLMSLVTRIMDERNADALKPDDPKFKDILKQAAEEALRQHLADQQRKAGKMQGTSYRFSQW